MSVGFFRWGILFSYSILPIFCLVLKLEQVLKSPAIIIDLYYTTPFFDTYTFNTSICSWWIDI